MYIRFDSFLFYFNLIFVILYYTFNIGYKSTKLLLPCYDKKESFNVNNKLSGLFMEYFILNNDTN